jgi:putrescine importer
LSLSYQLGAELLNFGAFIAFMGVNLAAFVRYWVRSDDRRLMNAVLPLSGFFVCLYLWLSLRSPAQVAGGAWLAAGVIYGAIRTRGFTRQMMSFEIPSEETGKESS